MRSWSDNIEIMMGSKIDDNINELTDSLLQNGISRRLQSMNKSKFDFDSVDLLYSHLRKISLKREKSYIKSPEWLENKTAAINLKIDDDDDDDDDDKWFQYVITVALNYIKFKKIDLQRILSTIQYDRKDIDFSTHLEDWQEV